MKLLSKIGLLALCIFSMQAELLVVKQGENGFLPLDASDEVNKAAIADVLLKYQWPMVIANTALTEQEQNELLTSGKPYAEEEFIRNKLKQIDERYDVVFIPTSLYELFAITQASIPNSPLAAAKGERDASWIDLVKFTQEDKNTLLAMAQPLAPEKPYEQLTREEKDDLLMATRPVSKDENAYVHYLLSLDPEDEKKLIQSSFFYTHEGFDKLKTRLEEQKGIIFFQDDEAAFLRKKYWDNKLTSKINSPKISEGKIDLHDILNIAGETPQAIRKKIYNVYRENNNFFYPDAFFYINNALLKKIFDYFPVLKSSQDVTVITNEIKNKSYKLAAFLINSSPSLERMKKEIDRQDTATINLQGILAKVIKLEIEASESNNAFLLRGTSYIGLKKTETSDGLKIMGTTIRDYDLLLKTYKNKKNLPYSISFGNSLFAGWFYDSGKDGACAYPYLTYHGGYALFVNKKDYIRHESLNLFFIAPLANLAALFAKGEYFHSRSKAAIPVAERGKQNKPTGFHYSSGYFIDPAGILTTIRDPLIHAGLFSEYLAKNMHIINSGNESDLTDEEKKVYEEKAQQKEQEFKQSQQQAAKYYKAITILEPFAIKASEKIRQKLKEKKQKEMELAETAKMKAVHAN